MTLFNCFIKTIWRTSDFLLPQSSSRKSIIQVSAESNPRKKIISIDPKPLVFINFKKFSEIDKHQMNIVTIMRFSNATPIRSKRSVGYSCCFCTSQFAEPTDLKNHTINSHNDEEKTNFMKNHYLNTYIVKLDITNLSCTLCNEAINSLDDLIAHLVKNHDKVYHTSIKNHIVPFRFDSSESLNCAICNNEFNNFKVLIEHMNKHYMNYLCKQCGAGFVNKRTLQTHQYRHKKGEYKCGRCDKIYDNKVKMKDHERAVHIRQNKRSKCGYCGEMFTDYTKKNDHEVRMHGAKTQVLQCHACEKKFDNQRSLTVHIKRYHMLEGRLKKTES